MKYHNMTHNSRHGRAVAEQEDGFNGLRAASEEPAFARTLEAAEFLGLSKGMIHKLIGQGRIPVCRYGRAVRIPWTWLKHEAGR